MKQKRAPDEAVYIVLGIVFGCIMSSIYYSM